MDFLRYELIASVRLFLLAALWQRLLGRQLSEQSWWGLLLICFGCLCRELGRQQSLGKAGVNADTVDTLGQHSGLAGLTSGHWGPLMLLIILGAALAMSYQERLLKMDNSSLPVSL